MFGQWWARRAAVPYPALEWAGADCDAVALGDAEGDAEGDAFDVAAFAMPTPLAPRAAAITAVATSRRARMEPPSLVRPLAGRLCTSLAGQPDGTLDRGSAVPLMTPQR
jgi:hypothetical protein